MKEKVSPKPPPVKMMPQNSCLTEEGAAPGSSSSSGEPEPKYSRKSHAKLGVKIGGMDEQSNIPMQPQDIEENQKLNTAQNDSPKSNWKYKSQKVEKKE